MGKTRKRKKKHIITREVETSVQWGTKWVKISVKIPREHFAKRLAKKKG